MIKPRLISYAQNREDIILKGFFYNNEIGFYVDIGAEAPTSLSVTKIFYDKGWRGINVEPIKRQYELFLEERPDDININAGIAAKSGELTFREYNGTGYSTFSKDMQKQHVGDDEQTVKDYEDYDVPVITLRQLFDENKVNSIQFLKIDVEGLEYEVLSSNNWEKYRPEVICIEANHVQKDWRPILRGQNYSLSFFDGLNEYYTDNTTERGKHFDYVKAIIYQEPIVNAQLLEDFEAYDKTVAWLDETNKSLSDQLEAAKAEINQLRAALREVDRLPHYAKKYLKLKVINTDRKVMRKLTRTIDYKPASIVGLDSAKDIKSLFALASKNDNANFERYSIEAKQHPLLPYYMKSRRMAHDTVRRTARKLKKGT